MKTAIYARISTKDKGQDIDNQLLQLKEYCRQMGYQITGEYVDNDSGGNPNRKAFREVFQDAGRRKFDLLLFWSLDRFSREGVTKTLDYLQLLESYGVAFKSYSEQYLDASGIFKDVIISLLATLAKQEKIRISERVKAGLHRASLKGRKGGRAKINMESQNKIKELKKEGLSNRKIGKALEISHSTVGLYL